MLCSYDEQFRYVTLQQTTEVPLIVAVGGLPQTGTAVPPGYCQQETSAQYPEKNTTNI